MLIEAEPAKLHHLIYDMKLGIFQSILIMIYSGKVIIYNFVFKKFDNIVFISDMISTKLMIDNKLKQNLFHSYIKTTIFLLDTLKNVNSKNF